MLITFNQKNYHGLTEHELVKFGRAIVSETKEGYCILSKVYVLFQRNMHVLSKKY
jgi:hypothetical protein